MILFVPARRAPLPASIIATLNSKALSVAFVPPDKLSFEFPELVKLSGCSVENEIVISLKDGAWLETDQTMVWGQKP